MDYNFIDNEVNQGGYVFKNGLEFSSLQHRKTDVNYKILVLNGTIKANTSENFQFFFLHFSGSIPFQIRELSSVRSLMKL